MTYHRGLRREIIEMVGYLFVGYVSLVFLFEAVFLGIFQPTIEGDS